MHSPVEFFVGFQNIIKLLKSDEQNLNYKHLKLKPLRYCMYAHNYNIISVYVPKPFHV